MRLGLSLIIFSLWAVPVCQAQTGQSVFEIRSQACEKMIEGESKASARVRATDKAVFAGIKKLDRIAETAKILDNHEINVFVYRLVDEFVEDLSVKTTSDEDGKVCVEAVGKINAANIDLTERDFIKDNAAISEPKPEAVAKAAEEAMREVAVKPTDPEALALVYVKNLQYYNGTETAKFVPELKQRLANNPYFYLTQEAELADYILMPKVLKAKVDTLDAGHKRLQMVVAIDISGIEQEPVTEYQNRFVLFGAEENEQQIAARLIRKLLENAGDGAMRRIERHEQQKFEKKVLGKSLSE